jgi:hypothetical protein
MRGLSEHERVPVREEVRGLAFAPPEDAAMIRGWSARAQRAADAALVRGLQELFCGYVERRRSAEEEGFGFRYLLWPGDAEILSANAAFWIRETASILHGFPLVADGKPAACRIRDGLRLREALVSRMIVLHEGLRKFLSDRPGLLGSDAGDIELLKYYQSRIEAVLEAVLERVQVPLYVYSLSSLSAVVEDRPLGE